MWRLDSVRILFCVRDSVAFVWVVRGIVFYGINTLDIYTHDINSKSEHLFQSSFRQMIVYGWKRKFLKESGFFVALINCRNIFFQFPYKIFCRIIMIWGIETIYSLTCSNGRLFTFDFRIENAWKTPWNGMKSY